MIVYAVILRIIVKYIERLYGFFPNSFSIFNRIDYICKQKFVKKLFPKSESTMKKAAILFFASVAILSVALSSCSKDSNSNDIIGIWNTEKILVRNGDEWTGAPEQIIQSVGLTWEFSHRHVKIGGQYSLKYDIHENIIELDNGTSLRIISFKENNMQLGTPVSEPTIQIMLSKTGK